MEAQSKTAQSRVGVVLVALATALGIVAIAYAATTGGSAWFGAVVLGGIPVLLLAACGVYLIARR